MNSGTAALIGIMTAIVGLATLAVILSRNSATTDVIGAFSNAFTSAIKEAVSPITSGTANGDYGS